MELNRVAWETLTNDEKSALMLQLGNDKSSWEVGEIMGRSHYKYLEIKYRAEHLLKMFTERLDVLGKIIPDGLSGDRSVIKFIRICIEQRKKPMEALNQINEEREGRRITKGMMNEKIIDQLDKWNVSDNAYDVVTYELVKEFDRWNNFRILPKPIQEPSAYKRRVKNSYKKHIRVISNIHPLSKAKLLKLYEVKKEPCLYMPLMSDGIGKIHRIKENIQSMDIISSLGIYLFDDYGDAEEYVEEIEEYIGKGKRECKDGLNFWPRYRESIKKAKNYEQVQKIPPTRRYLEQASAKLQFL